MYRFAYWIIRTSGWFGIGAGGVFIILAIAEVFGWSFVLGIALIFVGHIQIEFSDKCKKPGEGE